MSNPMISLVWTIGPLYTCVMDINKLLLLNPRDLDMIHRYGIPHDTDTNTVIQKNLKKKLFQIPIGMH